MLKYKTFKYKIYNFTSESNNINHHYENNI